MDQSARTAPHAARRNRLLQASALSSTRRLVLPALVALAALPAAAQAPAGNPVVPAPDGNGPKLDYGANGTPVVNITRPNDKGTSYNRYQQFNVDGRGVVLNNAERIVQSRLAGYIDGNADLRGTGGATLIVNEVVAANPSRLAGYIEVAGRGADLVLANAYGISCDGCGFINAPRVTLATGPTQRDGANNLTGFAAPAGTLSVTGRGLDASTSRLNLFARAIELNAGLYADEVVAAFGSGALDTEGNVTATGARDASAAAPAFGLDVAAVGGMYARSIRLIGTEQGLGVNVAGELAGLERGVSLSADGRIGIAGTVTAATDASIRGGATLDVTGQVYGSKSADVLAAGITGTGLLASGGNTTVRAGRVDGAIVYAAGLTADGKLSQAGVLSLSSGGTATISGRVLARDLVSVDAGQLVNRGLIAGGAVTVRSGALDNAGGAIDARAALDLRTGAVDNRGGTIQAGGALTVAAAGLANQDGTLLALGDGTLTASFTGAVGGRNGRIGGNGDVRLTTGTLSVDGGSAAVTAAKALTVNAAGIDIVNGGLIASTGAGSITSGGALAVTDGAVQSAAGLTVRANAITVAGRGRISGAESDVAAAGAVTNAGLIGATGTLRLGAATLDNTGTLVGERGLGVTAAGRLAQSGRIASGGDLVLSAGSLAATGGTIEASGRLAIDGGAVRIERANVLAFGAGPLLLNSAGVLTLDNARIGGNGDVALGGADVTLAGGSVTALVGLGVTARSGNLAVSGSQPLAAGGDLTLTAAGTLSYAGGDLSGGGRALTLKAGRIENRGRILHGGSGALTVDAGVLDNGGGTLAGGRAGASFRAGELRNDRGVLGADGAVTVAADRIDNAAGTIAGGAGLTLTAATLGNAAGGRIWSDRDATLTLSGVVQNRGTIAAGNALTLIAAGIDGAGGTLAGGNLLAVRSGGGSVGTLVAPNSLTLGIAGDLTNAAGDTIDAARDLTLTIGGSFVNGGTVSAGGTAAITTGGSLTNQDTGRIVARTIDLRAAGALTNRGLVNGGGVALTGGEVVNTAAIFGNRVALTGGRIENTGTAAIVASRGGLLSLASGGDIVNRDGATLYSLGAIAITGAGGAGRAASLENLSASIQAQGDIAIAAERVVNARAAFATEEAFVSSRRAEEQVRRGDRRTTTTYTETVTETRVTQDSGPARIVGGNIAIDTGSLDNAISTISAAGNLTIAAGAAVTNTAFTGYDTTTRVGSIHEEKRDCDFFGIFCDWDTIRRTPFTSVDSQQKFTIPSVLAASGTLTIDARTIGNLTLTPGGGTADIFAATASGGTVGATPGRVAGSGLDANFGFAITAPTDRTGGGSAGAVLTVGGLFRFADANARFLIESDTRFTNYNDFVSSDIFVSALGLDPTRVQRRLGDGLYEQQLIANQLVALTGAQRLNGYGDNQAQYRALLEAGATYARSVGLGLGIALSAEQVATLTSDIAILVETTVQTPSGPQTVLAPKVYLTRASSRDLTSGGAIIAGRDLQLRGADALTNAGVIRASASGTLLGGDVVNSGRLDLGARGIVSATGDLTDRGGVVTGGDLTLVAGRDVRLESVATTRTVATRYFNGRDDQNLSLTTATTNRGSAITATGDLQLLAGRTVTATGANLVAAGNVDIAARDGIALGSAVDTRTALTIGNEGKTNFRQTQDDRSNVLTSVQGGGAVTLATGGTLALTGAEVTAGGALTAQADRIAVQGVIDQTDLARDTRRKSGGFLSSTTTTSTYRGSDQTVVGSTLSGDTVALRSVGDTTILGSNVVADNGVAIRAGGAVDIGALTETDVENQSTRVKKSGLSFSGGGLFLGVAKTRDDVDTTSVTNVGSLVGSTAGDVTIDADRTLAVTGSQIIGTGTTRLTGESVAIRNVTDSVSTDTLSKSSSIGLSIGVQSPVLAGLQGVRDTARIVGNGNANARTTAVAGLAGGLAAYNTVDALTLGGANVASNVANGASLSIGFGASSSKATSTTTDQTNVASRVAGNDVLIAARGAGANSTILIEGSELSAARDIALSAPGAITLRSGVETDTLTQRNRSSGFALGVELGLSGSPTPFASFNAGRGNASGVDVRYAETLVTAGRNLTIDTGGTLTLQGAQARAERVAIVAAGLDIVSQQDTSTYASRQNDIGLSLSGRGTGSIGGNFARSRQQGDFASVAEQSGIFAGAGGFAIDVTGNTNLVGGVIASEAAAAANRLATGTLTASDLENRERYGASSVSIGGGLGDIRKTNDGTVGAPGANPVPGIRTGLGTLSATPPVALGAKGGQEGTTYSAIAPGTVAITSGDVASNAAVAALRRDTAAANAGALTRQFDDAKREEIALGFAATSQLANQTGTFLANRAREADARKAEADAYAKAADQAFAEGRFGDETNLRAQASALRLEALDIEDRFGPGGTYRQILTALTAAAGGNVTGGLGELARNAAINVVQQRGAALIGELLKDGTISQAQATILHAVTGCAAGAAGTTGGCGAGAAGQGGAAVINALLSGYDQQGEPLTSEDAEARTALVQAIVGAVGLAADVDGSELGVAVASAQAETDNNYLGRRQLLAQQRELAECRGGITCELATYAKYSAISNLQDGAILAGVPIGVGDQVIADISGLLELLKNPKAAYDAVKALATDPAVRRQLGAAVLADIDAKLAVFSRAMEYGGLGNSVAAGRVIGSVAVTVAGAATGAYGAAKAATIGIRLAVRGTEAVEAAVAARRTAAAAERALAANRAEAIRTGDTLAARAEAEAGSGGMVNASVRQAVGGREFTSPTGVRIVATPGRTTTVLGRFDSDIDTIINRTLDYPKTADFGANPGGYNLLNLPMAQPAATAFYRDGPQFWAQYNKPFLDAAIARNDVIVLATRPTTAALNRTLPDGRVIRSGFGAEYDYLYGKGYRYDRGSSRMVPPKGR